MSPHSFLAMVVDADAVLLSNTIEELVGEFSKRPPDVVVLQGFPVSKAWLSTMARQGKSEQQDRLADNNEYGNWVSRAIDFRLAQRNLVEFSAKEKLNLPIQITGSLFMIRSDVLKKTRFRSAYHQYRFPNNDNNNCDANVMSAQAEGVRKTGRRFEKLTICLLD